MSKKRDRGFGKVLEYLTGCYPDWKPSDATGAEYMLEFKDDDAADLMVAAKACVRESPFAPKISELRARMPSRPGVDVEAERARKVKWMIRFMERLERHAVGRDDSQTAIEALRIRDLLVNRGGWNETDGMWQRQWQDFLEEIDRRHRPKVYERFDRFARQYKDHGASPPIWEHGSALDEPLWT